MNYYACFGRGQRSDSRLLPEPVLVECPSCGAAIGEMCDFPENEESK